MQIYVLGNILGHFGRINAFHHVLTFFAVEPNGFLLYHVQYLINKLLRLLNPWSRIFFCSIVSAVVVTLLAHCLKL